MHVKTVMTLVAETLETLGQEVSKEDIHKKLEEDSVYS